jgi:hypothetical protein
MLVRVVGAGSGVQTFEANIAHDELADLEEGAILEEARGS